VCTNKRVCIIGAGFTGLAAATDLLASGASVHIVEQNDKLGGMAGGFQEPGWASSVEYTYHHWFATDLAFQEYAAKWNAANGLILKRPLTLVETKASGFVRMDSPTSLLKYPDISLIDRLRLGFVLLYLRKVEQWKHFENTTAEEWCRRWMGSATYEALWKPQLTSKFGADWEPKISMAFLWARLHARSPELGTFKGGFQKLADRAEAHLIQNGATIHKSVADALVESADDALWRVRINGEWQVFDCVVVATSPQALRTVASDVNPAFCRQVCNQPYLGARTTVLSLNSPLGKSKAYWYSLRPRVDSTFTVVVEHTNFVSSDEYGGENIVYLGEYLSSDSPEWNCDESVLHDKAIECIQRINPEITEDNIKRQWIYKYEYAQPVRGLNASADIPPLAIPDCKGLYYASMAHIYPWDRGTNYALELGGKVGKACNDFIRNGDK
jgi:protoporphyrinogen oxidase